jgi:15-cis-phytoene desaturase
MSEQKKVIVAGAGLAGLSCAIELIEKGYHPIVLESRPFVGGRTASWVEEGLEIETGLHRYLGFYRHLPKLLRKADLKLTDVVFWEDAVEMRLPGGPTAVYHASVHRPIRTLLSYLGNNHYLNPRDKAQLVRMFAWGLFDYFVRPKHLQKMTVDEYAKRHGVGQQAHDRALVPMTEGIFFTPPDRYAAYNLFGLIGPYLPHFWRFRIGGFRGGMSTVLADPIAKAVTKRGGEVRTSSTVSSITFDEDRVTGVKLDDGQTLVADWVILATSLDTTQKLLKPHYADQSWCAKLLKLGGVPVVTMHVDMDRQAMPKDRTTFGPLTHIASFAEQSRTTFNGSKGRLSLIMSPPQSFIGHDANSLMEVVLGELKKLNIDISGTVRSYRKVLLPTDFYSLEVGNEELRPKQKTPVLGLTLAGDYTKQKYLGTMEGAVYSGKVASDIVHRSLKR